MCRSEGVEGGQVRATAAPVEACRMRCGGHVRHVPVPVWTHRQARFRLQIQVAVEVATSRERFGAGSRLIAALRCASADGLLDVLQQ